MTRRSEVSQNGDNERAEWEALANADTLHLLPPAALIASIRYLAQRLLDLSPT